MILLQFYETIVGHYSPREAFLFFLDSGIERSKPSEILPVMAFNVGMYHYFEMAAFWVGGRTL